MIKSKREATINLEVQTFKKEKGDKTILVPFNVKITINRLEGYLANYISTSRKIEKPEDGSTRYSEAIDTMRELKKWYLMEAAGIDSYPEEVK